jgi:PBSX family phage terminase large subunit
MSLLDLCPGGTLLEPKRPVERAPDPGAADALRAKILADCLPAQREFLDDENHRILSYIGGFGSGKSFALAAKLIFLGLRNPGGTLMACEPTFPMIRTVLVPAIDMALDQWDIEYSFRASPQPEYSINLPTGPVTIYCQSAENYQRIRGQNICAAVWDECDTSPVDTAQKAGEMLLARMRTGELNQLAVASTPEGFRWAYRTFVENDGPDKRLIRVRTQDNPHLPADFIPSLERNYPSQLIQAYLEGHFVNLASCAIFPDFDRSLHYTDAQPRPDENIYIGIDINVGNCATAHCVKRDNAFHFFDEAVYRDTQQIADGLKELYPHHFQRGQLVLVPDAASKQRSTAAAQESDLGILKRAGHTVSMQRSNPLVQDRLNSANALINQNRLFVGNKCKHWRRSLEQWAYDDKGKPEKGAVGMDDLSHMADAATYVMYRMAAIRSYKIGSGKSRQAQVWGVIPLLLLATSCLC